jgi:NitT/TauT family transport system substrate-binding protein
MSKKAVEGIAIIVLIALAGLGAWYLSSPSIANSGMLENISLGTTEQELSGLIYIAEDMGFFSQNGLNMTVRYCDTGLACVEGMADGEAEIAASSEYPVVGMVLKQENISVISSIDKYQGQYIVGRKDLGIENVADLLGKEIGVASGTITEFYLGRFLYLNNISLQDVTFVNVRPSQFADSIGNGSVDAIIVPQAYLNSVEERLGSNATVWQAQSNQNAFGVLSCRSDWIASHPETINKLLKSLVLAENYALSHPTELKAILQERLNYTGEYMATIWPQHQYSLTLDQSLITAMEDEGRWMIDNNITNERQLPNFLDYVHEDGLKAIKPEAVNILR